VGTDDEVVWERKTMSAERSNFTYEGTPQPYLVGWDEMRSPKEEVRNYKAKPIRIELRHVIPGDIDLDAEGAKLHDYQTVEFTYDVKAHEKFAWHYKYTQHFGRNAKQGRVNLK
jgi:hypothetical protein